MPSVAVLSLLYCCHFEVLLLRGISLLDFLSTANKFEIIINLLVRNGRACLPQAGLPAGKGRSVPYTKKYLFDVRAIDNRPYIMIYFLFLLLQARNRQTNDL